MSKIIKPAPKVGLTNEYLDAVQQDAKDGNRIDVERVTVALLAEIVKELRRLNK